MTHKDGRPVHVIKNASLLIGHSQKVIGAVETLTDVTEMLRKENQIEAFRQELKHEDGFSGILGASAAIYRVFELVRNAARSDAPVIILGESGTGKELVARAIHDVGTREEKPFVNVNCAALNESLLESELFGHVKGAFTGAFRDRPGRFEAASGGEMFLDEIGDLPLHIQVKLLRVLEEKVVERVGANAPIPINVQIISATNRDLDALVSSEYYRPRNEFRQVPRNGSEPEGDPAPAADQCPATGQRQSYRSGPDSGRDAGDGLEPREMFWYPDGTLTSQPGKRSYLPGLLVIWKNYS